MRMFVAVLPSDAARESLEDWLEPRREHGDLRWSDAEQFHVTLAFCPDVPDRALDDFGERLTQAATRHTPFRLRLAGGGTFPDPDRAKLLYAALDAERSDLASLGGLAEKAKNAAAVSGITVEGRTFRPHLTIARSNRSVSAMRWLRALEGYGGPDWEVDAIHLVASHLGEGRERRPRYEVVESYPLTQGRLD